LTPELLAASGARYSRNNDGLDAILAKIDPEDLDKSVDSIFRMIDYGHQSIADMVPVAMFIDSISIWLAYYIWSICPTASGQESSTRYIKLSVDGLIPPEELGIPTDTIDNWRKQMEAAFAAYTEAITFWNGHAEQNPEVMRIPRTLLDDTTEKAVRQLARMRRNYAFDRARYFLPVAAATNVMLIMSARGWVHLCQQLLSHALPEAQHLGSAIREELSLSAPRMLRHAETKASLVRGLAQEFERVRHRAELDRSTHLTNLVSSFDRPPVASLEVIPPPEVSLDDIASDLAFHENRYAWVGTFLQRTSVRFSWDAVTMAEIRDLNRHRTGTKYAPLSPRGFYCATDELPSAPIENNRRYHRLADTGRSASLIASLQLSQGDPTYIYWTLLGTQYPFEHVTTADKFIYEAELRTGTGAHYRYARHLHDVLALWYERFPSTRGLVIEGSAEPE